MLPKRIVVLYVLVLSFCTLLMLRLSKLTTGAALQQAATVQSSYALTVGETRGLIYDRNLKPLVGSSSINLLAVAPGTQSIAALQLMLPRTEFLELMPLLESGKPVVLRASRPVVGTGVQSFVLPVRYSGNCLAPHVLGYLDGGGDGVAGVEAGCDDELQQMGGQIKVRYDINAVGQPLGEDATEVVDSRPEQQGGVVLTLDSKLQASVEQAAAVMEKGAVVVMDVQSGEILAMASVPDFDPNNVAAVLNEDDSPLFNRATAAYSVGSTFKLVVAAAALESGYSTGYGYVCPGYYELGEQRYYCHNREGHWQLAMERAVGQSCNPYFIHLGLQLGAGKLLAQASAMGFGSGSQLVEGVNSAAGTLPLNADEVRAGELANLSFGQGTLTATPVQVTKMTAIIANGGQHLQPTLRRGTTHDGLRVWQQQTTAQPSVLSKRTADTLQQLMVFVVENGSGKQAEPAYGGAGGKTGSAQTGVYENGVEVVHGWFTGFYPADNPRYAITVLEDGGGNGGARPAQVFAAVCDAIALQNDYNLRRNTK